MHLNDILTADLMRAHLANIETKKQALEVICKLISNNDENIKFSDVLEALQKRERLGSTAIGYGVAIPHARVKNLSHATCVIVTLESPVDFDSTEELHNQPVDLLFSLLVPEDASEEHLNLLSEIATRLKDKKYRDALKNAPSNETLLAAAISEQSNS